MRDNLPCLLVIENDFKHQIRNRYAEIMTKRIETDIMVFGQTWGSTALGFGGFGGQSMTHAYTTVIWDYGLGIYAVYFGNEVAYVIKEPNKLFFDDMYKNHSMASVRESDKYLSKDD